MDALNIGVLLFVPFSIWSIDLKHFTVLIEHYFCLMVTMIIIRASSIDCELCRITSLGKVPPGTSSILPKVHSVRFIFKRNSNVVPVVPLVRCVHYVNVVAKEKVWLT